MKAKILESLTKLEAERNIKILYAAESGSRAWGFPSPDSDYDVRIIYTQPIDWYLSLSPGKDTIDLGVDDDLLDITGWELRKVMNLAMKSNASPFEWIQSPIVYREESGFQRGFSKLIEPCFSPIASIHHYLSMAKNFHFKCAGEESVKLKAWFYGLRTCLNSLWILERKTVPPIHFEDTFSLLEKRPNLVGKIQKLIELKTASNETFLFEKDNELLIFMAEIIEKCKTGANDLSGGKPDREAMNDFFRRKIKRF